MPYTKSQLDKMFAELPDDVKEAMTSVDTVDILKEIQEKYHFHLDQIGDLSAEVGMLMLGATHPQRFISNVEKALGVSKETATEIATTVNEKIFKKVRHSLMELHQMAPTDTKKPATAEGYGTAKEETVTFEQKTPEAKPPASALSSSGVVKEEIKKPVVDPYKETI
jgi:hypothetical protein